MGLERSHYTIQQFRCVWQNPGGGLGVCPTWTAKLTCIPTATGPDQVYRINGTTVGGGTPTPTPTPTPTCTPGGGGLVIGSGLTLGFAPNGYQLIASNTVNYTFANSQAAPNDYAVFETHDPWGSTILTDAITANGHTFSVFTPNDLAGFDFSQYRVVVLNWDDTFLTDFNAQVLSGHPCIGSLR